MEKYDITGWCSIFMSVQMCLIRFNSGWYAGSSKTSCPCSYKILSTVNPSWNALFCSAILYSCNVRAFCKSEIFCNHNQSVITSFLAEDFGASFFLMLWYQALSKTTELGGKLWINFLHNRFEKCVKFMLWWQSPDTTVDFDTQLVQYNTQIFWQYVE